MGVMPGKADFRLDGAKGAGARNTTALASILAGRPRSKRPSGLLKEATYVTVGEAYDRDPCPHSLITWDTIADLERPDDMGRLRTRATEHRCERPGAHVRESRFVPDKHGDPLAVPDEQARLHADASGRVW